LRDQEETANSDASKRQCQKLNPNWAVTVRGVT
jgi:hypothetical protein